MSRTDLRTNEFAWRNGVKPARLDRGTKRAASLYAKAQDRARRILLAAGHRMEVAP